MTANSENDEKIDLDNTKDVEEAKKEFEEKIAYNKRWMDDFKKLADSAKPGYVTTTRQFYSLASLVYINHLETLEALKSYFSGFVDLNKELREKTEKLEKEIQYISKNTGVDLSEMKTQVAKIKEAVEAPIYKYVKTQQENEEKRRKLEDELLDWAIRSR
jgi:type IV secretory pathway VirB4 component